MKNLFELRLKKKVESLTSEPVLQERVTMARARSAREGEDWRWVTGTHQNRGVIFTLDRLRL